MSAHPNQGSVFHRSPPPDMNEQAIKLGPEALPNAPQCMVLHCGGTCSKCGVTVPQRLHCPTDKYGFRCTRCCEAKTHRAMRAIR